MLYPKGKNLCYLCRLKKYLVMCKVCESVGYILLPKYSENTIRAADLSSKSTMPPQSARQIEMPTHIVNLCLWGEFFRKLAGEFKIAHQDTNNYTDALKNNIHIKRIQIFPEINDKGSSDISVNSDLHNIKTVTLIWNAVSYKMLPSIYRILTFAKGLVGYRTLNTLDKLILIKRGFFAIWLTRATKVSTSTEIVFHEGSALTFQILEAIYDKDFAKDIFSYVAEINALNMTDDEIAGFTACLLFFPYEHTNLEKIAKVHGYTWEALQTVIIDRGITDYNKRFEAFGDAIRSAWRLEARHHKLLSWCRSNYEHLSVPLLFSEIFDIPYARNQGTESQKPTKSLNNNLSQRKG